MLNRAQASVTLELVAKECWVISLKAYCITLLKA